MNDEKQNYTYSIETDPSNGRRTIYAECMAEKAVSIVMAEKCGTIKPVDIINTTTTNNEKSMVFGLDEFEAAAKIVEIIDKPNHAWRVAIEQTPAGRVLSNAFMAEMEIKSAGLSKDFGEKVESGLEDYKTLQQYSDNIDS